LLLKQAVYTASLTVAYLSIFIKSFENVAYISCGWYYKTGNSACFDM